MVSYRTTGSLWPIAAIFLLLVGVSATQAGQHTRRNAESTEHGGLQSRKLPRPNARNSDKADPSTLRSRVRTKHGRLGKSLPDFVTVATKKGSYRGKVFNVLETRVAGFLGMRYAESPAGRLRFRKPVPVKKWPKNGDATSYPKSCFQWTDTTFGEGKLLTNYSIRFHSPQIHSIIVTLRIAK